MATTVSVGVGHPTFTGEVARLRMPVAIRGMDRLVTYLENAYGQNLFMEQEDDWLVFYVRET